ncbi:hypothetical protein QO034_22945 [Sedimentitalea sp. JM2-8]|uniref:Major facilitator superfamily (MFS) profile domain-containing protein n=1 Tax=Sedimentitalea xiamensis TaxID=3050037 RepID=A0ABT7FLC8_9RHOB|nr:hypothetical protein [Sedimentitalea xiamensis]MDK3075912.1 hypothetical protein [Sedimentitalea xiamensis]
MAAYLILSLLTGVLSSIIAAILGAGGWSIAICYVAGSWIGFLAPLLCVLLQRGDRRDDYLDARSGLLAKRAASDA